MHSSTCLQLLRSLYDTVLYVYNTPPSLYGIYKAVIYVCTLMLYKQKVGSILCRHELVLERRVLQKRCKIDVLYKKRHVES
jgi:hypothetical protein